MKIKNSVILIIVVFSVLSFAAFYLLRVRDDHKLDVVAVNDIAKSLSEQWESVGQKELPCLNYGLDYAVLDGRGNLLAATKDIQNYDINIAVKNRDTMVDIMDKDKSVGKLIIFNYTEDTLKRDKKGLFFTLEAILFITAAFSLIYTLYINRIIVRPFHKLKVFAQHVAEGNLDLPLTMDRENMFGAFTESFDLMRDELNKARENERLANQSKKELVASLSHDIKTPVASIKAVSEIMQVKSSDEEEKEQFNTIIEKADQINALITNMFNATLEELQELKVTVTEQSSQLIYGLIKKADYYNQVTISGISECIIVVDLLRLSQVIDNIIQNSYKYAGTSIEVTSSIQCRYLEITLKDFGKGVSEEEKPLLFHKFYRAGNSEGKSGAGLGLYISKYLMEKMSGEIECENVEDGFVLRLKLLLA
jgi:signal transduction histidine kinase